MEEVVGVVEEIIDELEDLTLLVLPPDLTLLVLAFFAEDVVVVVAPQPRFSTAETDSWVEAALADAPVMLAVAALVTSEEIEAARDAVLTLKTAVALATTVRGGPVADGEGASRTAAKSNC